MWGRRMLACLGVAVVVITAVPACADEPEVTAACSTQGLDTPAKVDALPATRARTPWTSVKTWLYQLQGYKGGGLDAVAAAPQDLAVIDLARDAKSDFFRADEIKAVRDSGKRVLAYFEIGSIEDFRPEYRATLDNGLVLNRWDDWPEEHFVCFWEEPWWEIAVRPRIDQALKAGFDGMYLDTPLAYEEIDLDLVPGASRESLAAGMAGLITRISAYAKARSADFGVFPQNSPELRHQRGYTAAIDGIGMEELFFLATDKPCTKSWCAGNLAETRALRAAGKLVLAVDYAVDADNIRTAKDRYAAEGFAGCVTVRELDRP
ncbi:cysteinyl-tRNA synthetase, unknown class [Asanoa hainanensis]|uniref:Glycoside-hydrolase family GH114 TIM-barrel domain-containing protein n=1 Tax=Asanoa hainanensis TaxID=560556 RepID=A0A239MIC0_9ACTN|nr:endo alpha-1,4 polygalactosaminidase [Asanoa hainanensis]SNT41549.1 cysteinyl-tRNA synthetase, unknown class [Asanoa hainanensis]